MALSRTASASMALSDEEQADHILALFPPLHSARGWASAWKEASDTARRAALFDDNKYASPQWLHDYTNWAPRTRQGHLLKLEAGLYGLDEIIWSEDDALRLFSALRLEASVFHTEPPPQSLRKTAYLWAAMAKYPQLIEDMPAVHPWFNSLVAATGLGEYRAPPLSDKIQRLTTRYPSYANPTNPLDAPLALALRQRESGKSFSAPSEVTAILETWDVLGDKDDLIAFIGSLPDRSKESLELPTLDYANSAIEFT